ncbi:Rieske (2Fe-2S) protein [Roseibium marinum]|uniref:Nitrite reductase/ring-hydroxylating ferredoxin subunit n=1 Tax=Roseibium marinum TaxID=281252 RepID=A0A2S3V1M2_9HYPH|nr:Rieske 2Fe-2S domain-containing protein [Roseibium marinum]POF33848.1 nitrite reductase/ring-hydroxylating ferredoxin subunit [Roseibium marinum]
MMETQTHEETPYVVCGLNDIPSKRAYGFCLIRLDEHGTEQPWPIVIIRWGLQAFGYVNRCPHDGVNLDWEQDQFLDAYGTRLMCGKHGALFDIGTGDCIDGPCKGEGLQPIDVRVIEGDICVLGVELAGYGEDGEEAGADDTE